VRRQLRKKYVIAQLNHPHIPPTLGAPSAKTLKNIAIWQH
jgi:hypothetical protein